MKQTNKSIIVLIIIGIILLLIYQSYLKRNPVEREVNSNEKAIDKIENIVLNLPESEYKDNKLKNGSSPFDIVYGKGIYAKTKNSLKVINQSASDVIVMLVRVSDGKVIRNEYIQCYSDFDMTNIPNCTCFSKFYYGKDWNPTRQLKGKNAGGFDSKEQFVISREEDDLLLFEVSEDGGYIYYSTYTLTLETIETSGNILEEENVSASKFF